MGISRSRITLVAAVIGVGLATTSTVATPAQATPTQATPTQATPTHAVGTAGASSPESVYVAVAPTRVASGSLGPGQASDLDLGESPGPPPGEATAVAMNLTVSGISSRTYLSVCPGGTSTVRCLDVSTVNPYAGRDVANFTIVPLGPSPRGGQDAIRVANNAGTVTFHVDLVGYFVAAGSTSAGGDLVTATPYRDDQAPQLGTGEAATVTMDRAPAGASAVAVRATAAGVTAGTFVSLCPAVQALSQCRRSSTLNPAAGRDTSNMTLVPLDADAQIQVYNNAGSLRVHLDILGFVVPRGGGARFVPVDPQRFLAGAPLDDTGDDTWYLDLYDGAAPTGTVGLFANLTTAGNTATTYLSVCTYDAPLEECLASSTVNSYPGQDTAAGAVVATSDSPQGPSFTVANNVGSTLVFADLLGYFVRP